MFKMKLFDETCRLEPYFFKYLIVTKMERRGSTANRSIAQHFTNENERAFAIMKMNEKRGESPEENNSPKSRKTNAKHPVIKPAQPFSLWQYNIKKDEMAASMGLDDDDKRRRDMLWVSFVLISIGLPIFVFGVDVYFYVKSQQILDNLDFVQRECYERSKPKYMDILETYYNETVIDLYSYALEDHYRPCLFLSVVLSVGMSIFFRLIVLGYKHKDVSSTVVAVILHSVLPIYMNVCVVKMDKYLLPTANGKISRDHSIVYQMQRFNKCFNSFDSISVQIDIKTKEIKKMQFLNRFAKASDWVCSGLLLAFVCYNYFSYINKKYRIRKKKAKEMSTIQNLSYHEQPPSSLLLSELVQVFSYIFAFFSFPLMFSVPFCMHRFWEDYDRSNQSLSNFFDKVGFNMNMFILCSGMAIWMTIGIGTVYHILRLVWSRRAGLYDAIKNLHNDLLPKTNKSSDSVDTAGEIDTNENDFLNNDRLEETSQML